MLETLRNAWAVKDIRRKILFTVFILIVFRIGSVIPVPFVNVKEILSGGGIGGNNDFFSYLSILTGGGLQYGAIFALSVTPYINSSIIMQLLSVAIPALERLSREGEEGKKKLAQLTRYTTVILALLQGIAYFVYLDNSDCTLYTDGFKYWLGAIVIVLCFTAGSTLVMWLGEQIDTKGIGNGISMILFAGIISQAPEAADVLISLFSISPVSVVLIIAIFLALVMFVVWMTGAERRIPVQYAKRVVGNKMYGGQNTHIPIKVNMSGVMPVIFASSILMLPTMILSFGYPTAPLANDETGWYKFLTLFSPQSALYAILYFLLILGFAYFYANIQFNPVEMTNNLRKNGGSIPGIRPGKPTSDFISKILSRITLMGAFFLSIVALLPIIIQAIPSLSIGGLTVGGTSLLILVGVALDTVQNLESQMMMRHYKGFLD